MGARDIQEAIDRLQRLERLVDAYGHLLTASELERALPGLVPILATGEVSQADAGGYLKEILQRGPAGLLAELEDLERIGRAVKDPQVYAALNQARDVFLFVARYNAAALLRRLDQRPPTGPAAALQKEVQAFMQGVARIAPVSGTEVDEVFADEELPGAEPPVADAGNGSAGPGASPVEPPVRAEERPPQREDPPTLPEPLPAPWLADPEDPAADVQSTALRSADGPATSAEETIDWLRDRVDVFNDMLQRWAGSERLTADASPLVRRGRFTPERCRDLYRELLEAGAVPILEQLAVLSDADGEAGDRARALRSLIVDGAVGSVPRLLGILSSGGPMDTEVDGAWEEPARVLADLVAYLAGAAELYDAGSPLRDRLLYLAGELRAVTGR